MKTPIPWAVGVLLAVLVAVTATACDTNRPAPPEKPEPTAETACANVVAIMKREAPDSVTDDQVDSCIENMNADAGCTDRESAIRCLSEASNGDELVACGRYCR